MNLFNYSNTKSPKNVWEDGKNYFSKMINIFTILIFIFLALELSHLIFTILVNQNVEMYKNGLNTNDGTKVLMDYFNANSNTTNIVAASISSSFCIYIIYQLFTSKIKALKEKNPLLLKGSNMVLVLFLSFLLILNPFFIFNILFSNVYSYFKQSFIKENPQLIIYLILNFLLPLISLIFLIFATFIPGHAIKKFQSEYRISLAYEGQKNFYDSLSKNSDDLNNIFSSFGPFGPSGSKNNKNNSSEEKKSEHIQELNEYEKKDLEKKSKLDELSLSELRAIAKKLNIFGYMEMKREELTKLIMRHSD